MCCDNRHRQMYMFFMWEECAKLCSDMNIGICLGVVGGRHGISYMKAAFHLVCVRLLPIFLLPNIWMHCLYYIMQPVPSLKICLSLSSTHCEKNDSDKMYLKNSYLIKFIKRITNFQICFLYFNNRPSINVCCNSIYCQFEIYW